MFHPSFQICSWHQILNQLHPSHRVDDNLPILFMTANSFFPSISLFRTSSSTHLLLVPSGSLESRTWMITSLLSITFLSSRMKAFDDESRVKEESIGANVSPFDGPASSGSCCIAATAANDRGVGRGPPAIAYLSVVAWLLEWSYF